MRSSVGAGDPLKGGLTIRAYALIFDLGAYASKLIRERKQMEQLYKFPPFLVQHLVEVAQNYREGIFAGTNDIVEKITGTPALSVPAFIEKNRKAFA
jgi:NAD(P)H dehydrogenase (quinone)